MLKQTPNFLVWKATTLPTKLGGNKKRWLPNKIKSTWEKKTVFHCKEWWAASIFALFPCLFEIVTQSADGTAKLLLWMYVDIFREWVLWDFLHFGVLSSTKKGTKWAYQPNLAELGLSPALKLWNRCCITLNYPKYFQIANSKKMDLSPSGWNLNMYVC